MSSETTVEKLLKLSIFTLPMTNKKITIQHFIENGIIESFLNSLDINEIKTLYITYEHLGSSFDLERSIIFCSWMNRTDN